MDIDRALLQLSAVIRPEVGSRGPERPRANGSFGKMTDIKVLFIHAFIYGAPHKKQPLTLGGQKSPVNSEHVRGSARLQNTKAPRNAVNSLLLSRREERLPVESTNGLWMKAVRLDGLPVTH